MPRVAIETFGEITEIPEIAALRQDARNLCRRVGRDKTVPALHRKDATHQISLKDRGHVITNKNNNKNVMEKKKIKTHLCCALVMEKRFVETDKQFRAHVT